MLRSTFSVYIQYTDVLIQMQRNSLENALSELNKHVVMKGFFLQVITREPNCSSNAPFPFVCLSRARTLTLLCKLFRNIKQRPENGCLFFLIFLFGVIHFGWPIAMICDSWIASWMSCVSDAHFSFLHSWTHTLSLFHIVSSFNRMPAIFPSLSVCAVRLCIYIQRRMAHAVHCQFHWCGG